MLTIRQCDFPLMRTTLWQRAARSVPSEVTLCLNPMFFPLGVRKPFDKCSAYIQCPEGGAALKRDLVVVLGNARTYSRPQKMDPEKMQHGELVFTRFGQPVIRFPFLPLLQVGHALKSLSIETKIENDDPEEDAAVRRRLIEADF